jgi:Regulator of ribonuclease activity B
MSGKTPRIGDICEIKTPAGLAYIQYTHDSREMGQLVRVLPGLFDIRPTDVAELAKQRELYFVFYTLDSALRDDQVAVHSYQPVPEWARPYPLMRWCGARDPSGRAIAWKIFSASNPLTMEEHRRTPLIYNLTPEQKRLSIHQLWPHPVMVKELARGWTPERAEELRLQDIAQAEKRRTSSVSGKRLSEPMKHYLYFPKEPNAQRAGELLRSRGFSVEVRKGASGEDWLAVATKACPKTSEQMDELRDEMEALAAQFGGEYDGWEAATDSLGAENVERGQKVN